jgi:SAM-dependent methyltransferase
MSSYQALFYPESTFGGITDIDGTVAFYCRVNALLQPSFVVLDFGCGRGKHQDDPVGFRRTLCSIRGKVSKVIGIDVDPIGLTNPLLDEFRLLVPDGPWPLKDGEVDLIVCDTVIEHLPDPSSFFREARRVLATGGYLCIRTPNAHSYLGVASRLVPNKYHSRVLSKVQTARKEEDVFPTLYRCNTISSLRQSLRHNKFRAVVYGWEPEPSYLSFSKLAYAAGVAYQKFVPGFLRMTIFAFGQSQERPTSGQTTAHLKDLTESQP